jgi:hypothetical protein
VRRRAKSWSLARYNVETGRPLLAALLMSMVGGMGLRAAIQRRER